MIQTPSDSEAKSDRAGRNRYRRSLGRPVLITDPLLGRRFSRISRTWGRSNAAEFAVFDEALQVGGKSGWLHDLHDAPNRGAGLPVDVVALQQRLMLAQSPQKRNPMTVLNRSADRGVARRVLRLEAQSSPGVEAAWSFAVCSA